MEDVQIAVRAFFTTMGVDLNPPKSIFFNDRQGTLLVKATLQDLDIIEAAVQVLNIAPPQVNIKAKFAEISQDDVHALGFNWYLGNFLMNNNAIGAQGGTAPSFVGQPSAANPSGVFPGNVAAGTAILPSATDQLLTSGLRNTYGQNNPVPTVATVTGILTDPQFRVVINALDQRSGVDILNAPEVTTLSGRQAQVQVVDIPTIVTSVSLPQTASGGGTTTSGTTATSGNGVVAAATTYTTQSEPIGTTLDVIPYVSADGFTIQMSILPTVTEFLGYDNPGQFIPQAQSVGPTITTITAELPLPHFRVRQVTTSVIVWDGQTVVLGGLITDNVTRYKDKVPVLGDMPLVGKLFQSESSESTKVNLVIFVTPTLIDPAGNRLHSEDEMPFAQTAVPSQSPVVNGK